MINVNQEGESKNSEEEEDWEVEKKQREAEVLFVLLFSTGKLLQRVFIQEPQQCTFYKL